MNTKREKYKNMSIEERLELIERIFIAHPSFDRCFNTIKECHEQSRLSVEPICGVIWGEPGSGKTTLCNKYEEAHPRIELEERTKITVLLASIPIPVTPRNMVTALLVALGDPLADKGTAYSKTLRLFNLLKLAGVEIIIIDEFQHIIDKDSDKVLYTVSDWLKQLINVAALPIVLVGLPHSVKILNTNEQLARRFSMRTEFTDFKWKNSHKKKVDNSLETPNKKNNSDDFRVFLKMVDDALPLLEDSQLASKSIAFPIWKITKGNVSQTMKLIRYAARLALENGEEQITRLRLKEAYQKLFSEDSSQNPFDKK